VQDPSDKPVWCQLVRSLCNNSNPKVARQAVAELAASRVSHLRVTASRHHRQLWQLQPGSTHPHGLLLAVVYIYWGSPKLLLLFAGPW
jgi:hypothetical protein